MSDDPALNAGGRTVTDHPKVTPAPSLGTPQDDSRGGRSVAGDDTRPAGESHERSSGLSEGGLRETGRSLRDEATAHAESGKDDLADRLSRTAEHVHRSADSVRGDETWLADLMDRGSRELDSFAGQLKNRDFAGLIRTAEDFARRQPAAFMGTSVAVGFALGRLARATASHASTTSSGAMSHRLWRG